MPNNVRQRVARERRLRGLSVRSAAVLGGVSNTTWGRWETSGVDLTDGMRVAVARAFGWGSDWPENPPPETAHPVDDRLARIEALLQALRTDIAAGLQRSTEDRATTARNVARLADATREGVALVAELRDRVAALEATLNGRRGTPPRVGQ
jgi:transcriptional regulator with XRE-family HTH domain